MYVMSDDLVGLAAAYMRYQEGCSDNLKRSIRKKAESGSHSRNLQVFQYSMLIMHNNKIVSTDVCVRSNESS